MQSKQESDLKDENLKATYVRIRRIAVEIIEWTPPPDQISAYAPPYYTDHGVHHSERILANIDRISEPIKMNQDELFILLCSVWLHDVGMFVNRKAGEPPELARELHHLRSVEFIRKESKTWGLEEWQVVNISDVCRAHRSSVVFDHDPKIPRERDTADGTSKIRVQLLCCLLRLADSCDVNNARAPEVVFQIHKECISQPSQVHWRKHFNTHNVIFNFEKRSIEVPVIFPAEKAKWKIQLQLAELLETEIRCELNSVQEILVYYDIPLYRVEVKDYTSGEYINFRHIPIKNTLGWTIEPFATEFVNSNSDTFIMKPILSKSEVERFYIETNKTRKIHQSMVERGFKDCQLFLSHPRTGKTSMLSFLSEKAIDSGFEVLWFYKQASVPTCSELIDVLAAYEEIDQKIILVFDNVHEDVQIISLIEELIKVRPDITIWCTSRISEFADIRDKWAQLKDIFYEYEAPGYLDNEAIEYFLTKFTDLLDTESKAAILEKQNITAYYLVDLYMSLKNNQLQKPVEVVGQIPLDIPEDNKKTYGLLSEIERLALKIISYLNVSPRVLLEGLLNKVDNIKSEGIVDSLLSRNIVFNQSAIITALQKRTIQEIRMFDSFNDFIKEQMFQLDVDTTIPSLLINLAEDADSELLEYILLNMLLKYPSLNKENQRNIGKIVLANKNNSFVLNVGGFLSQYDESFTNLANLALVKATDPNSLMAYAGALKGKGLHDLAIAFAKRALEMKPDNAQWMHNLAHLFEDAGDLETAIISMHDAAIKNPEYNECLGILYFKADQLVKAMEFCDKSINFDNSSISIIIKANIYERQNDLNKARDMYEQVLKLEPENAKALRGMARLLISQGEVESAKEFITRLSQVSLDDSDDLIMLADLYMEIEEYDLAKRRFLDLNELMAKDQRIYYALGYCSDELEEYNESIEYYSKAIHIDPTYIKAYVNRGSVSYNSQRDYTNALNDFNMAISIKPSHALAHVCRGRALRALGLITEGIDAWETALRLGIDEDFTIDKFNNLAYSMIDEGIDVPLMGLYLESAIESVQDCFENKKIKAYLIATQGLYFLRLGKTRKGREIYERAIQLLPDDHDLKQKFHYEYGRALRNNLKYKMAIKHFYTALGIQSNYVSREEIEKEIRLTEQG